MLLQYEYNNSEKEIAFKVDQSHQANTQSVE